MIQIVTHNKFEVSEDVRINTFKSFDSLSDYDVNVIDLRGTTVWRNTSNNKDFRSEESINIMDDIIALSKQIKNTNSEVLVILPQELLYTWTYGAETKGKSLRNMISVVKTIICNLVGIEKDSYDLLNGKTSTTLGNHIYSCDYTFNVSSIFNKLTYSKSGTSATTIKHFNRNLYLTTLDFESTDKVKHFLTEVNLIDKRTESRPIWMEEILMFDDDVQHHTILNCRSEIEQKQNQILEAEKILFQNDRYKSILFTQSDSLVEIVFEILEIILGCKLKEFVDIKKEDFSFKINDEYFIGEIKGVNSNVQGRHLSQLENHYRGFLDDNGTVQGTNVHALLIINHQKDKPLSERVQIHENQIKLAKRNGSLIIETHQLLKMLERFKSGELSRDDCLKLLRKKDSGVLTIH